MTSTSPLAASLTADERALVDSAARFRRDHGAPRGAGWECARQMRRKSLGEAARLGLCAIEVPRAQGGRGAGFAAKALIAEELARSCMAFAFSLINTQNVGARIAGGGWTPQIARYLAPLLAGELIGATSLTEPQAGSDFPAITTTARRAGSGWVLDGEKAWLTNAALAEVIIVYAKTDAAPGSDGIAAFLVDARAPGFERLPPYALMGGQGLREDYPIGRHIACARIAGYVDGTTEMQNERIGALLEKTYL